MFWHILFFVAAMATPTGNHSYVYRGSLHGLIGTDSLRRVNVNDPGLITLVNKLQDVFTTVGVCQEAGNASAYTFIMLGTDKLQRRFKIP